MNLIWQGKMYLLGQRLSLADICVFCRLLLMPYVGMKVSEINFPNITRWMENLEERESFSDVATTIRSRLDRILDIDDGTSSFRSSSSITSIPGVNLSAPSTPISTGAPTPEPEHLSTFAEMGGCIFKKMFINRNL